MLIWLLTTLAVGCTGDSRRTTRPAPAPPPSRGGVAELHLFGVPVTLNLDTRPGPDGFAVTLYASNGRQAKGIEISSGAVELLMFDGVLKFEGDGPPAPRRVWKFSPSELRALQSRTALGIGYRLALRWEDTPPTVNRITVVARYLPSRGPAIASGPSTITVAVE